MENNESNHYVVPAAVFYFLLGAAGLGGAGVMGVSHPGGQTASECQAAAKAAGDKADAALRISAENTRQIANLQDLITERTRDRYTKAEHIDFSRTQNSRDEQQERRLGTAERDIDTLKRKHDRGTQ